MTSCQGQVLVDPPHNYRGDEIHSNLGEDLRLLAQ
jgi:hypothetical protein